LTVEKQPFDDLALQRTYVEMEIPEFLEFKIRHIEKFPDQDLVHPPLSSRLLDCGNEFLQKSIELDPGFKVLFEGHGGNLLVREFVR
jgi:hypothetical protein